MFENLPFWVCGSCVSSNETESKGKSKEVFEGRFLQKVAIAEGRKSGGSRAEKHNIVRKHWHTIGDKGMMTREQDLQGTDKPNISTESHIDMGSKG